MARTYKRDSRGRFASGSGGGSTGKPAAKKTAGKPAASKPAAGKPATKKPAAGKPAAKKPAAGKAAASKPATNGRRGPRGGKVGTKAQQAKAKREQQARSKQFASKKQATSAQKAWKAASRGARMSEKGAARKVMRAGRSLAKSARQPLTMEQRKAKLLQVHGRALEADLSKRKGLTRYQVRDILDAGSAATVVRSIKQWVAKNRGSMAATPKSPVKLKPRRSKPTQLRPEYSEVVAANKRRLRLLNRQIRQGAPGKIQLLNERRNLQVKIMQLESQGRRR